MTTTIFFIRHSNSREIKLKRKHTLLDCNKNTGLSREGRIIARDFSKNKYLQNIDVLISSDARFHYKQSGAAFIVYLGVSIVESVLGAIAFALALTPLFIVSVLIGIVTSLIGLVSLAVFILSIIAVVKAFNDERFEIPVVINIANAIWKE